MATKMREAAVVAVTGAKKVGKTFETIKQIEKTLQANRKY